MSYSIDQLAADCRRALAADPGPNGRARAVEAVKRALADRAFLAEHLGPHEDSQRKVLYEDADLGFCILAHVYKGARNSPPHDHGPSWAIYGQADGVTEMTDWQLVAPPAGDKPGKVRLVRTYSLAPGDAHLYNERALHSPRRDSDTRLIRIEGRNLENVKRDKFEPV